MTDFRPATFPTWTEAREALRLMQIVYGDDDFFVAAIWSRPGIYEGRFEEGGRVLRMCDVEIAADEIAFT